MVARLIDGKARAAQLRRDVAAQAAALKARSGIVPGLCAILVGDDPASEIYVRSKGKATIDAGLASFEEQHDIYRERGASKISPFF